MRKSILESRIPLTKVELSRIKIRAIRRGSWFKVLSRVERASIDLTLKVVRKVRSLLLAKMLTTIVKKLLDAMESKVARLMREVGCGFTQNLSRIAQKWGNKSAVHWTADSKFAQYLTIMYINTPPMFKT